VRLLLRTSSDIAGRSVGRSWIPLAKRRVAGQCRSRAISAVCGRKPDDCFHEPAATSSAETSGTVASALGRRPAQAAVLAAPLARRQRGSSAAGDESAQIVPERSRRRRPFALALSSVVNRTADCQNRTSAGFGVALKRHRTMPSTCCSSALVSLHCGYARRPTRPQLLKTRRHMAAGKHQIQS
jgi:hypothetical protein